MQQNIYSLHIFTQNGKSAHSDSQSVLQASIECMLAQYMDSIKCMWDQSKDLTNSALVHHSLKNGQVQK